MDNNEMINDIRALYNRIKVWGSMNDNPMFMIVFEMACKNIKNSMSKIKDEKEKSDALSDIFTQLSGMCRECSKGLTCPMCKMKCTYRKRFSDEEKESLIKNMGLDDDECKDDIENMRW